MFVGEMFVWQRVFSLFFDHDSRIKEKDINIYRVKKNENKKSKKEQEQKNKRTSIARTRAKTRRGETKTKAVTDKAEVVVRSSFRLSKYSPGAATAQQRQEH